MLDSAWYRKWELQFEAEVVRLSAELQRMKSILAATRAAREQTEQEEGLFRPSKRRKRHQHITAAAIRYLKNSAIRPEMGIIKSVRAVLLGAARRPVLPTEVRDELVESGFQNSRNFLPEIHAALRRLAKRKEVRAVKAGTRTAYRWKGTRMH
jgi:hypothetical protein